MLNLIQGCRVGFVVFLFFFIYCICVSTFFTSRALAFIDTGDRIRLFCLIPFYTHSTIKIAMLILLPIWLPENTEKSFLYVFSPHCLYSCPISVLYYCFPFESHLVLQVVTMYLTFTISLYVDITLIGLTVWSLFSRKVLRNGSWGQYFLSS